MNGWLVIKTDRYKENFVQLQLKELLGADAYLPLIKFGKHSLSTGKARIEPLFPGYLFARFDISTRLFHLRRVRGYQSYVCFDGRPACVDDSVIVDLRRRESRSGYITLRAPSDPLHVNQKLRVTEGAFSGQTGVLVRHLDSAQRICMLLDGLRSGGRLELPLDSVAAFDGRTT